MGVPRSKHTKSRKGKRRLHQRLKTPSFIDCPKCGKPTLFHSVCSYCGYYKGKEVINVLAKLEKKEKKKREREIREKEKEEKSSRPLTLEQLSKK